MRILLMTDGIPPETLGGTGGIVRMLATHLAHRGHDVHILTAGEGVAMTTEGAVSVHRVRRLPPRWAHFRSVFSERRAREICAVIDHVQPDLIHAHTVAWQCGYRWIHGAARRKIPVIMHAHDVMHVSCWRVLGTEKWWQVDGKDLRRFRWTWNPLRRPLIRRALRRTERIICVSDALRLFLQPFRLGTLETLHNGINLAFWHATQEQRAARATLSIPQDAPTFLLAGRLGVDKGTNVVAQTLPPTAHLILAGAADLGPFERHADRIHFFPRQSPEQMRVLYAAADVVLVPSLCLDCFPTVCLEGMACCRPVLATSFGGAQESVTDGETGWVIDPRDTVAFRKRLEWCVDHRDQLMEIGRAGRSRVERYFPMEQMVEALEDRYTQAASAR